MKLLLDTHAFLWFIAGSSNLSDVARENIEALENERYVSVASAWEIAIKMSLGKLKTSAGFEEIIPAQLDLNAMNLLPISPRHLALVASLPFHHRDPFDRLILAQSLVENIPVISVDSSFDSYGIQRIW